MSTKPDMIDVPADTVLGLAAAAVYGARQRDYGSPHIGDNVLDAPRRRNPIAPLGFNR